MSYVLQKVMKRSYDRCTIVFQLRNVKFLLKHTVHVYDSSGKKMTSIGSKGIGELQFKTPREYLSISGKLVKCWRVWQTQDPRVDNWKWLCLITYICPFHSQ